MEILSKFPSQTRQLQHHLCTLFHSTTSKSTTEIDLRSRVHHHVEIVSRTSKPNCRRTCIHCQPKRGKQKSNPQSSHHTTITDIRTSGRRATRERLNTELHAVPPEVSTNMDRLKAQNARQEPTHDASTPVSLSCHGASKGDEHQPPGFPRRQRLGVLSVEVPLVHCTTTTNMQRRLAKRVHPGVPRSPGPHVASIVLVEALFSIAVVSQSTPAISRRRP